MESWMRWLLLCCHFLFFHFSPSHSLCHLHDAFALLQFKSSFSVYTDYPPCESDYSKTETWENGTDCCSWTGVTCHPISGHVIGLDLSCGNLQGIIHPNSTLFHLSHLQSLNLAFNDFHHSHFSSLFGAFSSLTYLNLSGYNFEGEIPPQISHLSKLASLDISGNYNLKWKEDTLKRLLRNATVLRELILDQTNMSSVSTSSLNFSSSLVTLSLPYVGLRGNLTNDILCLPNLQHLYLSHLQIQLPIVSCSTASLSTVSLSFCDFQGSISPSFSNFTHLTSVELYDNYHNGSFPSSLLTLPRLSFLSLECSDLIGQIPNLFPPSNRFEELHLIHNGLRGELPSTLSNLQNLIVLDLSNNEFSGQIPPSLFDLTQLHDLDCANNKLQGPLPNNISGLRKLTTLSLGHNLLNGTIPSWCLSLPTLVSLDLSENQFTGPLPNNISGLRKLTTLSLGHNLLNGTIPSWCLSLPTLVSLDLSENQFTGPISAISSFSLMYLYLDDNKLQGNIPESIFNLVNLTNINLSSNRLCGSVHFPLFAKIQKLERLDLSQNDQLSLNFKFIVNYNFSCLRSLNLSSMGLTECPRLSGKVPVLEFLDLSNNKLDGGVSNWFHELSSLQVLDLSHNLLTQSLDILFRNNQLEYLDPSFNSFIGGISSSICNMSSIRILNLSHNKLTGTIPQCLANLPSLGVLDLRMNKLYGTFPILKNKGLETLDLSGNQLEGPLPKSLSNCASLKVLDVGNNQIEDMFPNWLQSLPFLQVLVLRANKFHGPVVELKTKHVFLNLIIFDISSNNFSGNIPTTYIKNFKGMKYVIHNVIQYWKCSDYTRACYNGNHYFDSVTVTTKAIIMTMDKIRTDFVSIDLSENIFEGEIPNVIGELRALRGLNLSHNRLRGPIPLSLGNLTNIESLDLSSNMLTGRIPIELSNLNFLEVLNLSNNHLVGEIPQGKQFNTFSKDSYEGNLELCGLPLTMKCNKDLHQDFPPSPTLSREQGYRFGWEPVAIGYGCGMVFGVGMGCCVLLIGKPRWLVRMVGGQLNKNMKRKSRMRSNEHGSRMN